MSEYYVYSKDHAYDGIMDGCIVWWRARGHGYTNRLNQAGVFTDEDKEKGYPPPKTCNYVPVEIVRSVAETLSIAWHDGIVDAMKAAGEATPCSK